MAACSLYSSCFFAYLWLLPVFLQFLIRAPSNLDQAPFYPVPTRTLAGDVPDLYMSSFPQTTRPGVNHCRPCQETNGQRSGMYQWDIMLSISEKDLIKESRDKPVSTMYPLVFASNDAKVWKVVADADDVAGKGHWAGKDNDADEATHLSAPLLVANLKNFGCVDQENKHTDPFFHHFKTQDEALQYKWRLVKHVAMHGSVNLVACVMQGMDDVNQLIHTYARDCRYQGELKCHLTPAQALGKCFALGSACGQACGYFSPKSPVCRDGTLDKRLFAGLTERRVKIKTSPGGGGAAEALVYCSKSPCSSGMHFNDMYVEAENPIEFLEAQMDARNKEKGSYYMLMFAMSDFHAPMHTFEVVSDDDDEDEDEDEDAEESSHHHRHHEKADDEEEDEKKAKDDEEKDEKGDAEKKDEKKEEPEKKEEKSATKAPPKPKKKKPVKRTCVDLPGVRLGEIAHSGLAHFVKGKGTDSPLGCTAWCGQHKECQQSVFAQQIKGCYLFKVPTVEVRNYSTLFNSSYCGPSSDKHLMMKMLHQAYKNYVPPEPKEPLSPLRRLSESEEYSPLRGLQGMVSGSTTEEISASKRYYWQIAHVPNGTKGVLTDQGANEVRVIPRNTSCFTTPGFVYMVACMTAKPVYVPDRTQPIRPPPFNDRCLAVGGLCGATCGSGQQVTEHVARYCPLGGRRLQGGSPYASAHIPRELMVRNIGAQKNSEQQSCAARVFFNLFVFIAAVSYVSTILSKFPGLFEDRHPVHTWDEIHMHGYLVEKFGAAVSCTSSSEDGKKVVLRNWLGKITTRPQFDDSAFATFRQWVDVFCDEGHREGARQLWAAWADFLATNPPLEFLQEWAAALRDGTSEPFELKSKKGKKVLPVTPAQASGFDGEAPQGGTSLQQDSLARLRDLAELYGALPEDLGGERAVARSDDVVLVKRLGMELKAGSRGENGFQLTYSNAWRSDFDKKAEARAKDLGTVRDKYEASLTVTDKEGKKLRALKDAQAEHFPLHIREPLATKGREVVLIYCARGKPKGSKGVEKTQGLDKFHWACLHPSAVRKPENQKSLKTTSNGAPEKTPLLDDVSERSYTSTSFRPDVEVMEEVKKAVESTVSQQNKEGERDYLQLRSVDSDWEMARCMYGEVVGEERDQEGDAVVILDNPSPALLALVAEPPMPADGSQPAMGLVNFDEEPASGCFGSPKRTVRPSRPSLQFKFVNTKPDTPETQNFPQEMVKRLQQAVADPSVNLDKLKVQEKRKGNELLVAVTGPAKAVERVRSKNIRDLKVLNYQGRMMDTHPCIAVKKQLLVPFGGVRGGCGGLNFVLELLQAREGFLGSGSEQDPMPGRLLFAVFDASQQPHPDFWKRCLPKFVTNCDKGYTYKVNEEVAFVQAPEEHGSEESSLTGASSSVLNLVRTKCAGVTAGSGNAVWQVSAKQLAGCSGAYFETRAHLPGTATSHARFCEGKRSVYVQEEVATGLATPMGDGLVGLQRQAEGSVQLFWLELLLNRRAAILRGLLFVLAIFALLYSFLFGFTLKDLIGYNLFCDASAPSLLLGDRSVVCTAPCAFFGRWLASDSDAARPELAERDYMQLVDASFCWLLVTVVVAVSLAFVNATGKMPSVVRALIMVENVTYWMGSWHVFYWLALVLFLVMGMDPPLLFSPKPFMLLALLANLTQHCLLGDFKSARSEISIWRSQQCCTMAAPLFVAAMAQGTVNAWQAILGSRDCSVWRSSTTSEAVATVTVWVSLVWAAFLCCLAAIAAVNGLQLLSHSAAPGLQGEEQLSAAALLGLVALTVWEPFVTLWGMDTSAEKAKGCRRRCCAKLVAFWRGKAWLLRYVLDFVVPLLVLFNVVKGSHALIVLVAYAGTVHGLRM